MRDLGALRLVEHHEAHGDRGCLRGVDAVHRGKGDDAERLEVDAHDVAVAVLEEVDHLLVGLDALEGRGEAVFEAGGEDRLVEAVDFVGPEDGVGLEVSEGQGALAAQRVVPSHEHAGHDGADLHADAIGCFQPADREQGVEGAGAQARQRALADADGELRLHPKRVRHEARDDAADELVL